MNKKSLIKTLGVCCVVLLSVISIFSFFGCYTPAPLEYSGFIRVSDGKLVDENGLEYMIKGINTTDNWFETFEKVSHRAESYIDMADYGMNTVRICLNASKFEEEIDGVWVLREYGITELKKSIENAAAVGIRCIIDMHCPPGCGVNAYDQGGTTNDRSLVENKDLQTRFINIWEFIAKNFADNENVLGYGLVNEPVGPRNEEKVTDASLEWAVEQYELLLDETIAAIRKQDTNHVLILQPLLATYYIGNAGRINTEQAPIEWGGKITQITSPLVDDPAKNVMIEQHWYKHRISYTGSDIVYSHGQTMVAPTVRTANTTPYTNGTEGSWTTWDWWSSHGMRKSNVISRDEYNGLIENENYEEINARWFTAASKINRMKTDPVNNPFDVAHASLTLSFKFGLNASTKPLDIDYYVDDLKLVKKDSEGNVIEEFETDFNDRDKLRQYGGYRILNYITENPFKDDGDMLLHYNNTNLSDAGANGYNGVYSFTLLDKLPLLKEEDWEVSAKILAVGDAAPSDADTANYVRYKVFVTRYNRIDPTQPAFIYMNKDGMRISLGESNRTRAARYAEYYDCPVYVGELGAHYNSLDEDPNYLEWFKDISDIIKEYKINFTWHSYVGGGYGIYKGYPVEVSNKHERTEEGFRKYLFKTN